jgi:hypothetical protein
MLNLFIKDIKVGAIFLWAVVPLYVVTALQVSRVGAGFFWVNVTCASLLLVAVSMLDWKNEAEPFVLSLPVTRAMVVRARYLTAVVVGLLSLVIGLAIGAARGISLVMRAEPWPRWMAGDVGLAFVLVFAFIASVYLPCYYRWGFGKGNVAAALVLAAAGIATDIVGPAMPGAASAPGGGPFYEGVPRGQVTQGVARLADRYGMAAAGLIVLGLAAVLLWVSAQVAARACRRQEF